MHKNILIGYGNPGRLDDGLGPALAARIEAMSIPNLTVETDYQLVAEHAYQILDYRSVIFVDASMAGDSPFTFSEILAAENPNISSHSLSPQTVLYLAKSIFHSETTGYLLAVRGYDFDQFGEYLSEPARSNLELAFNFIYGFLLNN